MWRVGELQRVKAVWKVVDGGGGMQSSGCGGLDSFGELWMDTDLGAGGFGGLENCGGWTLVEGRTIVEGWRDLEVWHLVVFFKSGTTPINVVLHSSQSNASV